MEAMSLPQYFMMGCTLQIARHVSLRLCITETRTIILVHGDCLYRTDLTLEFRLSPDTGRPLDPVKKISEDLLDEWRVADLVKPKVSRPNLCLNHV